MSAGAGLLALVITLGACKPDSSEAPQATATSATSSGASTANPAGSAPLDHAASGGAAGGAGAAGAAGAAGRGEAGGGSGEGGAAGGGQAGGAAGGGGAGAYSREGIKPLPADCQDAKAVLGQAAVDDRKLLGQIRQAMAAQKDFEIVSGKLETPRQISLWKAEYGPKIFSRQIEGEKEHYAVIAYCHDPESCLTLAAMVRAVIPGAKPELMCGRPPAISGGIEALTGPWIKAPLPQTTSSPAPPRRSTGSSGP